MSKSCINLALFVAVAVAFCLSLVKQAPVASASPRLQATPAPIDTAITPTRSPVSGDENYVIEAGDSLWSIAVKFYGNGSKYTAIVSANNLPDNAILRVGTAIVIPALTDATSGPAAAFSPTPTSSPSAIASPPSPTVAVFQSSTPAAQDVVAATRPTFSTPIPRIADPAVTPLIPQIATALNVLSGICFVGSLFCAFLSIDAYRQSRRFAIRRRIGNRIRVKT
jgi:LysM repeat protein